MAPKRKGKGRKIPITIKKADKDEKAEEKDVQNPSEAEPEAQVEEVEAESLPEAEAERTREELEAEIADLKAQLEGQNDALLRAVADLENYKRRAAREMQDRTTFANERILSALLPPLDDCDRALEALQGGSDPDAVLEGVQLVSRQLRSALANFGLAEIPAEGQPFDPNVHEAIAAIPSAEHDEGTIVQVERKGYAFHGRVLRPAQVVVAKAPQEAEAEQPTEEG